MKRTGIKILLLCLICLPFLVLMSQEEQMIHAVNRERNRKPIIIPHKDPEPIYDN